MTSSDFDRERLLRLISEVLEGRLTAPEREELNAMLRSGPAARRFYREQMDLHTRLYAYHTGSKDDDLTPCVPLRHPGAGFGWLHVALLAAAASVALLAVVLRHDRPVDETFATIESSRFARWDNSDLATFNGARLGAGWLQLSEGLVTIRFDSGAEVTLEGPARLMMRSAMACTLVKGTIVAEVQESAIGFMVETPSALVTDHGTRFAVSVDPHTMETYAQVFEGWISVRHRTSDEELAVRAGQRTHTEGGRLNPALGGLSESGIATESQVMPRGPDWVIRETAKDAYIGNRTLGHDSEVLLYVKNGERGSHRKAYLGFDLEGLEGGRMAEAELILHFAPTGRGLVSHVPDATFGVYGLIADTPWEEDSLTIGGAPANIPGTGAGLDSALVTKLGSFMVEQGVLQGKFGISGDLLTGFLRDRAGTSVTLIVVRETAETGAASLIHGFTSRRHPYLQGPTLAIRMGEPIE